MNEIHDYTELVEIPDLNHEQSPQSLCVVPKQAPYSRTQKSSSSKAIVSDNMQTKSSSLFQLEKQKSAERLKLLDTLMENERKTLQLYQEKIELTSKLIQN
ncbi:unnamed protein product [Didymodactylos carnosus]|uniref:Uncharacterized protein n=1 Tax=Didymodactylos carnosus TaxID=1234261 RepID=A0A8S2IAD5_9BILA|nr:unnamed protein product [Didymodactylos carnosus]CAF3720797.1 unnamed protein product [Didymodactylos carnosus]